MKIITQLLIALIVIVLIIVMIPFGILGFWWQVIVTGWLRGGDLFWWFDKQTDKLK